MTLLNDENCADRWEQIKLVFYIHVQMAVVTLLRRHKESVLQWRKALRDKILIEFSVNLIKMVLCRKKMNSGLRNCRIFKQL